MKKIVYVNVLLFFSFLFILNLKFFINLEPPKLIDTHEIENMIIERDLTIINDKISGEVVIKPPDYTNISEFKLVKFNFFNSNDTRFWRSNKLLPRALNNLEYEKLMRLIEIMTTILTKFKIEFMLIDGSLIGSWRHWNIIPYDDDFDILVSYSKYYNLVRALQAQKSDEFDWTSFHNTRFNFDYLKLYLRDAPYAGAKHWRFPFIDILFYEENATHIWQQNNYVLQSIKSNIFPLRLRPFGKYWLPSPKKPNGYLTSSGYTNIDTQCLSSNWNHRNEDVQHVVKHECSVLMNDYYFVKRTCDEYVCNETLYLEHNPLKQTKIMFNL